MLGDVLERNLVLPTPVTEGSSEAGLDVTVELRLSGHGKSFE
jgi:hypothetical protein